MISHLPVVTDGPAGDAPYAGMSADHPMRRVTLAAAFDPGSWTDERRRRVTELFDGLAEDWSSRDVTGREAPILDAPTGGWRPLRRPSAVSPSTSGAPTGSTAAI